MSNIDRIKLKLEDLRFMGSDCCWLDYQDYNEFREYLICLDPDKNLETWMIGTSWQTIHKNRFNYATPFGYITVYNPDSFPETGMSDWIKD